jgi:hypothetical protein
MALNTKVMEFPPEVVVQVSPILRKIGPLLQEVIQLLNELPAEIRRTIISAAQASMVSVQLVKTYLFLEKQIPHL